MLNSPAGNGAAPHAVIIGGGLGGMAAALRLRAKGYRVTLFERGPMLGGRAQVFERDGFRYDAGPTVITAQFLFEELFALFGRRMEDYVTLVPLDPWYRFRFPDGDTFDYGGTVEDTLAEIRRFEPADADGYLRLLAHSEQLFNAGFTGLADQPFHNFSTMLSQAPALVKLGAHRTVWQMIAKYLKNPKLRQAFSIQPLLVGGSPFDTTSIYGLIHFLERKWGVHFAMGGTGAMIAGIGRLMEETGIDVRLNETVARVTLEGRKVTGVSLANGRTVPAEIVVSNADPMHLFTEMLPSNKLGAGARLKMRAARLSMGLFLLYFGTRRQYPEVAHHTIWLGERFRELLDDIFKRGTLADDFSLYIHRPTATDPSFAPEGCDSFYALCPVPNLSAGLDWSVEGPRLRGKIVEALDRTILPGLRETITAELMLTPADFKQNYLSYQGSGFSIAPYFTQSAWFRFHNRAEGIDGLYLTGAGTHPGAGMPGVLCSAKVIDKLIPAVAR
ncbi:MULTISPECIES: phytoene desaturase family protein [Rhodomicrobium]|uniref:phytoene desaturase family protein n=1 Tax=Rhodomicrobium TaxID=1068 RepID=UPI000B4BD3AB|nr:MULTISPECIES: phytoene desaturase family protein [Rhodomicrobium]